jgi:hypothetical protein
MALLKGGLMKRFLFVSIVASAAAFALQGAAAAGGSGGVTGAAFYVDGSEYRTVGTLTDLLTTGAPASSFDTLYEVSAYQPLNVAEAAPGDPDYNGGRWMVHAVTFTDYDAALDMYDANTSGDFDSAEEVEAALLAGAATDEGIVKSFTCPVIKLR